jgi:hypothetical protein
LKLRNWTLTSVTWALAPGSKRLNVLISIGFCQSPAGSLGKSL